MFPLHVQFRSFKTSAIAFGRYQDLVAKVIPAIKEVTTQDLSSKLKVAANLKAAPLVIDIREPDEWRQGIIPNSLKIPRGVLESQIEQFKPKEEQEIILYCAKGFRSALAAESLQRMGYKNVKSLQGGIIEWAEKQFALQK